MKTVLCPRFKDTMCLQKYRTEVHKGQIGEKKNTVGLQHTWITCSASTHAFKETCLG